METIKETVAVLEINKLPEGGYTVADGFNRISEYRQMRFACTSIDEALKYVKGKLEPKTKTTA